MEVDTERTSVKTYVPAYQREVWERHAEELDMSRSEFVRTMVQAGRRSFESGGENTSVADFTATDSSEGVQANGAGGNVVDVPDVGGGENDLDARILEILDREGTLSWDDLLTELTGDMEQRLETALDRLQRENTIQYSGRHGGYTRLEDDGD